MPDLDTPSIETADPQDQAEVFDETHIDDEGEGDLPPDLAPDVFDATRPRSAESLTGRGEELEDEAGLDGDGAGGRQEVPWIAMGDLDQVPDDHLNAADFESDDPTDEDEDADPFDEEEA